MSNYDLLILAGPKDYAKCQYSIDCATKFLEPKPQKIYVVSPTKYDHPRRSDIINVMDSDALPTLDITQIKYRPNWIKQQLIKLLQDITENDKYLVIDSDFFLTSKLSIKTNVNQFFLTIDQYHAPYFSFQKELLDIDKQYNYSFISEIMMFDKNIIYTMLKRKNMLKSDFIYFCYKTINNNIYLSEFELYGNYTYYYYQDSICFDKLKTLRYGKECIKDEIVWSDEEINKAINYAKQNQFNAVGLHSWSRT